jgi:5'-3' exonuclease, N-terminal resolvase-like domain
LFFASSHRFPAKFVQAFGVPSTQVVIDRRPVFRDQLASKAILRSESMIEHPSRPLLVIDGDSFAHRAYHALPKSVRRRGNKGGGAIVGFANFLLRLYENERPRAVLVGWDMLDVPAYRHGAFAAYQSGRQFDPELRDQLEVLPFHG